MKTKYFFPLLSLLPVEVLAADSTYKLLAPLPGLSTVTLVQYLEGAVKVTIGMAGILAVLMIVICGVQMIGSPSVSQKSASKECITSALFGLLLAISSWLILNTINTQLLSSDLSMVDLPEVVLPPPPPPADAPRPVSPGFYYRYREAAGKPIQNSPRWPTPESCIAVMTQEKGDGRIIEQTPPGSGIECFQVFPPPPGPPPPPGGPPVEPPLADAEVRIKICGNNSCINATPIGINKGPCLTPKQEDCTSVAGLPDSVVTALKTLSGSGPIVLSGGTEAGHKTHGPGQVVFDLRMTTSLNKYVKSNAIQSAVSFVNCRYRLNIGGSNFWFTDEAGAKGGPHWHICAEGQPYWYCTQNSRGPTPPKYMDGKALPDGIAINCPR